MPAEPPRKLFTPEAANRLLPGLRERLAALRALHREVLAIQGKVDIEEMSGELPGGVITDPARTRIAELHEEMGKRVEAFEDRLEELHALGCELKDLTRGLVDFYTMRDGELAYLCWEEGEDAIRFWHPIEGGYGARQPL